MLSFTLALLASVGLAGAILSAPRDRLDHDHCTATAVDCAATADGGCIAATSADGSPLDFRMVYVPPKTYGPGEKRDVYKQFQNYPRIVDASRAPSYAPTSPDQKPSVPIGYIDMPEGTTYGYWDAAYGVMNEAGLSMGESSCSGRLSSVPKGDGPNGSGALFWVGELSDIALEVCSTARCAIQTMGKLAEEHGFYGSIGVKEAGEALTIADGTEVWVFHILTDDTAEGAVWAAQRVPKGHATIVPNVFVIREIDPTDGDNFMFSDNIFDIALRLGWWDGQGLLDFAATYSVSEYNNPYYSGRRVWRGLSLFAPSLNLDPTLGVEWDHPTYPFSVEPDEPVTIDFMRRFYRDHMEGTAYDLTDHVVAGGPFKTPNRYAGGRAEATFQHGAWERAISLYRTMYSYIAVTYKDYNVIYFAPMTPHASVYIPIIVKHDQTVKSIPALEYSWQGEFSDKSLWWASETVCNVMDLKYMYMINDVRKAQYEIEHEVDVMMATESPDQVETKMDGFGDNVTEKWLNMHYTLLGKYQNGYSDWGYTQVGYGPSTEWLHAAGFQDFQATPAQFTELRRRYEKTQKEADEIRDSALNA
ncbi:conserved hypothetical protein [Perkinsus marinus ATCC 50983]|uniref:Dipeptidase n=2 Tax=Perkinsus marinus (strain ATCC 50983 / TXsc) TaxID=423536 RepID=C5LTV2_PERM5|nr:conserved hypothetical protein [Perkinsus marinus ATCC 50983]EEQ99840.1 conserved hypothetical protein [Perkinsus marinus ATCC 50983]|eukprot:XP_002767123.1 conserved hypothetical protein [Perkinsus marinus ATCC 50983]